MHDEPKTREPSVRAGSPNTIGALVVAIGFILSRLYFHWLGVRFETSSLKWYWQVLEVDLSGQACGKKAAFASKGYFANKRNRRGRQVGYVTVAAYQEVVVKQLYPGQTQLFQALPELVQLASHRLGLDQAKRHKTILRVDAGGGSIAAINWVLAQGYHFHRSARH